MPNWEPGEWCKLASARNECMCAEWRCARCGWSAGEAADRHRVIKTHGLSNVSGRRKGLKIKPRPNYLQAKGLV